MADYSINAVPRRASFSGSAGVGPYAFTFEILDENDVAVYKNQTLLTLTTDYTVTINANGTGSITLTSAATSTDTLIILGARDIERTTDFVTAGDLRASSLNEQLDSLTIFDQQIDERVDRAIKIAPYDDSTVDLNLPIASDRADKLLQFDTDGSPGVVSTEELVAGLAGSVLSANYVANSATGDGSTTAYALSTAPGSKTNVQVYIDGVYQNKASFTLSGTTLTFTEAPPLNASVEFIIGYALGTTGDDAGSITYTQGGTGSQTRTVESRLQEVVSVKDFGAVGDGVTDDSAAINAAFDAGTGKLIVFPEGTYLATNIDINTDTYLLGLGKAVIKRPDNTVNFTRILHIGRGSFTAKIKNVVVENIQFDGNIANQLNSATDYDAGTDTIAFNGSYQQNHSVYVGLRNAADLGVSNVTFKNCVFNGSQGDGVAVSRLASNVKFTDCYFRACARGGVDQFGAASSVFINNCIFDDSLHVENDINDPSDPKAYCYVSNTFMKSHQINGSYTTDGVDFYATNCQFNSSPLIIRAGGVVSNCSFSCKGEASASGARIIESKRLLFANTNFSGDNTVTRGLISLEPSASSSTPNNLSFRGCEFSSSVAVNAFVETQTNGYDGSKLYVSDCDFLGLTNVIDYLYKGEKLFTNNRIKDCESLIKIYPYSGSPKTIEYLETKNNSFKECDYAYIIAQNPSSAQMANVYFEDNHWIHSSNIWPQISFPNGSTNPDEIGLDRRIFRLKSTDINISSGGTYPYAWNGAEIIITDISSLTSGDPVRYVAHNGNDPTDYRKWKVVATLP